MKRRAKTKMECEKTICEVCGKSFSTVYRRRYHQKIHEKLEDNVLIKTNIKCPLCQTNIGNNDALIGHLKYLHEVKVETFNFNFNTTEEFEAWKREENREVDYACKKRRKTVP